MIGFTKGPVAQGTIRTSFVLGLRLLTQLATFLLLARLLGPQQFGAYAGLAALAVLLGKLSTFGSHLVLLREVSVEYERRREILAYSVPTTIVIGGVLLLLYLSTARPLAATAEVSFRLLAVLGVTELALQPLLTLPAAQLQAQRKIVRSQLLITLPLILRLVFLVALSLIGVADVLGGFIYGCLFASLAGLTVATLGIDGVWPGAATWRLAGRRELRDSAAFAVMSITTVGPGEIDKVLALRFLPLSVAGLYSAASRVIGAVTLPVVAMVMSVLPRLFEGAHSPSGIQPKLLVALFLSAFGYGVVVSSLLWIASPYAVWLLGDAYAGVGVAIAWLAMAVPGYALRLTCGALLMSSKEPWMRVLYEVTGILALAVVAAAAAPGFGLRGMATAIIAAEWTMAALGIWLVYRSRSRLLKGGGSL